MLRKPYNIVIVGASFIGITTALLLCDLGISIAIIGNISLKREKNKASKLLAIANHSLNLFSKCGLGDEINSMGQAIKHIRIVDSNSTAKVDFSPLELFLEDFGCMIDEDNLREILYNKLIEKSELNANLSVFLNQKIEKISVDQYCGTIKTSENELTCDLIIGADGRNSIVREDCGIGFSTTDYKQTAIVIDIEHSTWTHDGIAVEKFTPNGPFAVLPKIGDINSSIVWIENGFVSEGNLLNLGDNIILEIIKNKLDGYLGEVKITSKPSVFPLKLVQSHERYKEHVVLIGDAAQSIHPVAGQGLNLGLRDIENLVKFIKKHHRLGGNLGSEQLLSEYSKSRIMDVNKMIRSTTCIVKLFSNDILPIKIARRVGLKLFDKIGFLKKRSMNYAAGVEEV